MRFQVYQQIQHSLTPPDSAIVRTLNTVHETDGISTPYPISAFITHLVHLHDTEVAVDVQKITVREGSSGTTYLNHTDLRIEHGCEVHWCEWGAGEAI